MFARNDFAGFRDNLQLHLDVMNASLISQMHMYFYAGITEISYNYTFCIRKIYFYFVFATWLVRLSA